MTGVNEDFLKVSERVGGVRSGLQLRGRGDAFLGRCYWEMEKRHPRGGPLPVK